LAIVDYAPKRLRDKANKTVCVNTSQSKGNILARNNNPDVAVCLNAGNWDGNDHR
jgi:hypothetical protein